MNALGFLLTIGGIWLIYEATKMLRGGGTSPALAAPAPGGSGSGGAPTPPAAGSGAGSVVPPPAQSNPGAGGGGSQPPANDPGGPTSNLSWVNEAYAVARRAGIDPNVLATLIYGESGGAKNAAGDLGQSRGPLQVYTGPGGPGGGYSDACLQDTQCAFNVPGVGSRITAVYNCYVNGTSSGGYGCHYPGVGVGGLLSQSNPDVWARFWADAQGACYAGGAANGCPYSNVGTRDIAAGVLSRAKAILGW